NTNTGAGSGHSDLSKNKEAERVRMRVRQLLDGLHQNNSKSLTSSSLSSTCPDAIVANNATNPISSNQSLFSSGKRSILPAGSKVLTNSSLNTRHLQITRQLT
ncbi:unnamed protein product, partial [Schistosoma turkestanicum]